MSSSSRFGVIQPWDLLFFFFFFFKKKKAKKNKKGGWVSGVFLPPSKTPPPATLIWLSSSAPAGPNARRRQPSWRGSSLRISTMRRTTDASSPPWRRPRARQHEFCGSCGLLGLAGRKANDGGTRGARVRFAGGTRCAAKRPRTTPSREFLSWNQGGESRLTEGGK